MKLLPHPAIVLDVVVVERVALLAYVPTDAEQGCQLASLRILVAEQIRPDPQNYWLLQVGTIEGGAFKLATRENDLQGGLSANVVRVLPFESPVLFARGADVAIRLSPRGAPPPIAGLSVTPEWGDLSSRRSARGGS